MKLGLKLWSSAFERNLFSLVVTIVFAGMTLGAFAACDSHRSDYAPPSPSQLPNMGADPPRPTRAVLAAEPGPVVDPLVIVSGTSGTYTVPNGYVTGWSAVAGDAGATVTVTPTGPTIADAGPQAPIVIPAGYTFALPRPVIAGASYEMGTGTKIVFSGTVAYTVILSQGGT